MTRERKLPFYGRRAQGRSFPARDVFSRVQGRGFFGWRNCTTDGPDLA